MLKFPLLLVFLFFSLNLAAQDYTVEDIEPYMLENAHAVVRDQYINIEIEAKDEMLISEKTAITILNEKGDQFAGTYDVYDNHSKIKNQRITIYNAAGEEIEVIKGREFRDRSLVDANTTFSDNRMKYYRYIPRAYPYTIVYESEVKNSSTLFLPSWVPVKNFNLSVEKSSFRIGNPKEIPFRIKEDNLDSLEVSEEVNSNEIRYSLRNYPALVHEILNPGIDEIVPNVSVVLEEFELAGVSGRATSWKDFGKWQYENLLRSRDQLPAETIETINQLVANTIDDKEKARLIYEYMQNKTRYISVQLGIGGWQPMPAADVDRLGYGDCKGLVNYTKALLASQGIESHYAVVYAGPEQKSIDADFTSMQGNHVILKVPFEDEDVWLECTSQTSPFNYLGSFTDDRNVLLVKPEGGEIDRTPAYSESENIVNTEAKVILDESGAFSAKVEVNTGGVLFQGKSSIATASAKDQDTYYKKGLANLKNIEIQDILISVDKQQQKVTENLNLNGYNYARKAGNQLLLPMDFISASNITLPQENERKFSVELTRAVTFKDNFHFIVPKNFVVDFLPKPKILESPFGTYTSHLEIKEEVGETQIIFNRTFILKQGKWPADQYDELREFLLKTNTNNNLKAILVAKN